MSDAKELMESILVDAANALCGDADVVTDKVHSGVRIITAAAGQLFIGCLMHGTQLLAIHVDVLLGPRVAGTGPQPFVSEPNTALNQILDGPFTFNVAADEPPVAAPWRSIAKELPPLLMWLATQREGEDGENVCFLRDVPGHTDLEWVDREGRTTITHHSFAPPTHWRFIAGGEPADLKRPLPRPVGGFCRQHSSAFGR